MKTDEPILIPDRAGVWLIDGAEVEVYPLEPVGGVLCIWGPENGYTYSGSQETQQCWDTDEWQGHIPVHKWLTFNKTPVKFLRKL
jgi:hypothetical protein